LLPRGGRLIGRGAEEIPSTIDTQEEKDAPDQEEAGRPHYPPHNRHWTHLKGDPYSREKRQVCQGERDTADRLHRLGKSFLVDFR
jgi:hypothetical protein